MTIEEIFILIENKTNTKINDKTRDRYLVDIRYMAFYLVNSYADGYVNDVEIAKYCVYDRTTIRRAIEVAPDYINQNKNIQQLYVELKDILIKSQKPNNKNVDDFYIDADYDSLRRKCINQQRSITRLRNSNRKYYDKFRKLK